MASTINLTCPECDKSLKAPSELLGKKIRCKACGAVFTARGEAGKSTTKPAAKPTKSKEKESVKPAKAKEEAKPASSADSSLEADDVPYGLTEEYLGRRCPDCANALDDEQIICLHCGYNTQTRVRVSMRKVRDTTPMDWFLWLLPGIACALAAIGLIGLTVWFDLYVTWEGTFGDAWYGFIAHQGFKWWLSIIAAYLVWLSGKFAVIRLVLNYRPPEIEEKIKPQAH
jgi:DNA-directed RNA polymerase subunit M/transcription elongation factor TFIIS